MEQGAGEETNFVRDQWNTSCTEIGVDVEVSSRWFERLRLMYSAQGRYYHTMHHIWSMLRVVNDGEVFPIVDDRNALVFACVFHDCVYDAKRKDNEEMSAVEWSAFCEECGVIGTALREKVADWILQTAHHMECNVASSSQDKLRFLDIDLSILAAPRADYDLYAQQIRKEYGHVPDDSFREGRSKVLRSFLTRQSLFFLGSFSTTLAHLNIETELERLK